MDQSDGLAGVWSLLRETGLHHVAPALIRCGVRSCSDLTGARNALLQSGVDPASVDLLVTRAGGPAPSLAPVAKRRRHDLPVQQDTGRASFQLALQAADPNNREQALRDLESSILAPTTAPAVASRVKMYQEVCRAWCVEPWPISHDSLRSFAASLKAGRYRSASLYFSTIFSYQQRTMATPVDRILSGMAKDFTRSILRGMGPGKLKDAFDLSLLGKLPPSYRAEPFSQHDLCHARDVCIIGGWYMLRELELASAVKGNLYVERDLVHILIPQHKTDQRGSMTVRSLRCCCRVLLRPMCPLHACGFEAFEQGSTA